eukprot:jgi/Mesen1/1413/ME000130S00498
MHSLSLQLSFQEALLSGVIHSQATVCRSIRASHVRASAGLQKPCSVSFSGNNLSSSPSHLKRALLPARRSRRNCCFRIQAVFVGAEFYGPSSETSAGSFYELLGVSQKESLAAIKDAYRHMARRFHPDVCPLGARECTKRFIEVQEAYETLSDPDRRAMYDYDISHPQKVARGEGLGQRRPWQRQRRPWEAQAKWTSQEEQDSHAFSQAVPGGKEGALPAAEPLFRWGSL